MIFLTGGSGLLGRELRRIWQRKGIAYRWLHHRPAGGDIRDGKGMGRYLDREIHLIVHCAAYTDVQRAQKEKALCYETNVTGTGNLASFGIPMLYISTEYVFDGERGGYRENDAPDPQNFYALTKLLGEYESRRTKSCVVRCLFKPRPFEHPRACVDQFTTGDYIDVMAREIAFAISLFNRLPLTIHIGTERKSTYELARRSRPDVGRIRLREIPVRLPRDTSLRTLLWERIKTENINRGKG